MHKAAIILVALLGQAAQFWSTRTRRHLHPKQAWTPPPWAEGLSKKLFDRIPEASPEPWIPSWLDEEEKSERRIEEAEKWRPTYIPEPWVGPLADDDERERIMDEHERVLGAQAAAPAPTWVTDWMREAGKPAPITVADCMPYYSLAPVPGPAPEAAPAPVALEEEPPAPVTEGASTASEADEYEERRIDMGGAFTMQEFKDCYGDDWEERWENADIDLPPPSRDEGDGSAVDFTVTSISKQGEKFVVTLDGPFTFTAEGEASMIKS